MLKEKGKIIIIMLLDITYYPPILSLCNILSNLGYEIVYIGGCSNIDTEKRLKQKSIKIYKYGIYGGNKVKRFFQQIQFRMMVKKVIKQEYSDDNSILWIVHAEAVSLFHAFLGKYYVIAHLLEFRLKMKFGNHLLSPFLDLRRQMPLANKVICCEYNRAQLTKAAFSLKKLPYILPNKVEINELISDDELPNDIKNMVEKYKNKKIILYQGVFNPERKLDTFIETIDHLPNEYVLFMMGGETELYYDLKNRYESQRIVFLPFLPPPIHLNITKMAHLGIISYLPVFNDFGRAINVLYCAPNKIYEYAKYGIPMISNDLPALKYAFMENKAGLCITEYNIDEIKNAIFAIEKDYITYSEEALKLYNSLNVQDIIKNILKE
jgi:glycosyltransferase involved in cell wall biosynthesis